MVALQNELLNFSYRELELPVQELFPRLDLQAMKDTFAYLREADPHATIYAVARALWNGGYTSLLHEYGFWDTHFQSFSGHCHQCTPALGAVLKVLGFEVSYLECFRIREHFTITGIIEQVPPAEEQSALKSEFLRIKRIPYCILEVMIKGVPYYITGKHVKPYGNGALALLTPECYQEFVGVFRHQDDASKSGIYVQSIMPKNNLAKANFSRRIVWAKQTYKDEKPELFCTFLRMKLV